MAFLLRFVMAYGVSADGNYALSGGSSAQYHLHVIVSILAGSWSRTDLSVNYPVGGSLYVPPLMDFQAAGVASIFQGSMGTTEAASFALAVLNPIFGALLCIPVYMIGKELFDKTIGVVAALVLAFMALPISTSVFSSGNEYALAAFLVAFAVYFLIRMVKAADADASAKRGVLLYGLIAGVFVMLSALTWNGFRIVIVMLAVAMVLQAVASRIRGKDFTGITLGYCVAILVGALIPAAYYVPAGLMDTVYSGSLFVAVVSVVFTLVFMALRSKPWVATIPALVVVFLVLCVALAVAAPEMFDDFIFGNSPYAGTMDQLVSDRVSMSNVAAYYGWLTMWLPICLALYESYVYLRRDHSATQLLMVVWLFVMFFATWTSYDNAAVVACVFGVGAVLVSAIMLKKTKPFSGEPAPFVMELPAYHIPSAKTVLMHTWERLWGFIKKAGTILFLACVVMWVLSTFGMENGSFGVVEDTANSLMAMAGGLIAPIFAPLGFGSWQPVAASISGFSAKEAIVTTMGVLANVDEELVEDTIAVAAGVKTWFPSTAAAFSFLLFNMLDSPCLAAIATMAQQMQSRKWFWFAIVFQNVFAYAVSLCVYQFGTVLAGGPVGVGTIAALAVLIFMLYMLFRPDPYKHTKKAARRSVAA